MVAVGRGGEADRSVRLDLIAQLVGSEGAAHRQRVAAPEAAVDAVVNAVVADVERGEEHDAVAVDSFLQGPGGAENHLEQPGVLRPQERGRLFDRERLLFKALGDDVLDRFPIGRGPLEQRGKVGVVDEIDRARAGFQCRQSRHAKPRYREAFAEPGRSTTLKVLPTSGRLSTEMSPSYSVTIFLSVDKPSPLPEMCRVLSFLMREKSRNSR